MPDECSFVRSEFRNSKPSANLEFNEKVNALKNSGKHVIHYGFGQSPFPVPDCLQNSLKKNTHQNAYLPMTGIPQLREELTKLHEEYDHVSLSKEGFIVAPGSKELIFLLFANFDGDVLIPNPAWPTYRPQCKLASIVPISIDANFDTKWKVTPESITSTVAKLSSKNRLLILTNPGNPSGICYTKEELEAIKDVCSKENILVLSDEIYARIKHSQETPFVSIAKIYPEGTILCSGFSKWASVGGWRMGYIHFPSSLQDLFKAVRNSASHTYSCAPAPMQFALTQALRENKKELEEYRKKCCIVLGLLADFCYRQLKEVGVTSHKSEAGYYFIPNFENIRKGLNKRNIKTGKEMTTSMLDEINVALMSTEAFERPHDELCVRFCFVCFDGETAMNNLDKCKDKDEWVKANCSDLHEGIMRLKKWVLQHS